MSDERALANRQESGMTRIRDFMLSPEVKTRFTDMMGKSAIYYLNQVLIVVANSNSLQQCEPQSILIAAMRAASLKLSVDPSSGQAWIIPYKGKATFQLGYRGVYELAMRTNLYRFINMIDVYEGETLTENRMTGMHTLSGHRTSNKITHWMLYFQLLNGFEKTFVMSVEEIDKHARRYSQAYSDTRSKWNDPIERPKMEKKTVLVNGLRKWGRFNPGDVEILDEIENSQGWIEGAINDLPGEDQVTRPADPQASETELLESMGFDTSPQNQKAEQPGADLALDPKDEPPPPTEDADPTAFWHYVQKERKMNREWGLNLLEKCGGAFGEALVLAKKTK